MLRATGQAIHTQSVAALFAYSEQQIVLPHVSAVRSLRRKGSFLVIGQITIVDRTRKVRTEQ